MRLRVHLVLDGNTLVVVGTGADPDAAAVRDAASLLHPDPEALISLVRDPGRLWERRDVPPAVAEYLAEVRALNPSGRLLQYPGSPWIAARVLREQARAAAQLHRCVGLDPGYSAAWKLLGKAQHEIGDIAAARHAWENGVLAARRNGDVQAEKEMNVFLRRLARTSTP